MKVCNNCKREVEDDMIYCPYCGTPINSESAGETASNSASPAIRILVVILVSIGLMLCVAGIFTHWIIGMIGGGCVGLGYAIHKAYIKGGEQ